MYTGVLLFFFLGKIFQKHSLYEEPSKITDWLYIHLYYSLEVEVDFTRENYVCVREEKKMQKRKHIVKQKMSSSVCWFFFFKGKATFVL